VVDTPAGSTATQQQPNTMTDRMTPPAPSRLSAAAPVVVLVILVLWQAFSQAGAIESGDVFWHIRTGDLILDSGIPAADSFSWTAQGEPWQPNAWLSDVIWAGLRAGFGLTAISLLRGAAVVAIALLVYWSARRRQAGPWASVAVAVVATLLINPFVSERPLLVGFLLFPVLLAAGQNYRSGSKWALAAAAGSMVLWSNLHGSFLTGVAVIGLYALGWMLEDRRWRRPLILGFTVAGAALVNPYFVSAYTHALTIRDASVNIEEWQPLSTTDPRGVLLLAFMAAAAWALTRLKAWRSYSASLPLVFLAAGTIGVVRTGGFFVLAAAPVVAAALSALATVRLRSWARPRRGPITIGFVVAGLLMAGQQFGNLSNAGSLGPRFSTELVAAVPAGCRLFNEYDLGGFVIDQRWPAVLVSQDGRNDMYGRARIELQEAWTLSSDSTVLDPSGVDCVLADLDRPITAALQDDSRWAEVTRSQYTVLMVKSP
jgi:hypothetical protein